MYWFLQKGFKKKAMGYKLLCCKVISLMMGKFRFHIVYFVLRNLCYFSGIFL